MTATLLNFSKSFIFITALFFTSATIAQDGTIYPLAAPDEPTAIPLNTGGVENQPSSETWFRQWGDPMARNITEATLTPFLPNPEKVLKYRLKPTDESLEDFKAWMNRPRPIPSDTSDTLKNTPPPSTQQRDLSDQLEDAEAAYAMIIDRADEWGVDINRIGMIGFSAGAGLTMHSTLNSKTMKLAFIGPIYGGMGPVDVPNSAPPMFNIIATDDFLFRGQFGVIESWYKAGIPVEFHLYQNGGHGFGLGNPNRTSNRWFDSFMHWLEVNKFLEANIIKKSK